MRLDFCVRDSRFRTKLRYPSSLKARVAPMKALSIPKLELQAALLATRLKDDILTALTVCINHAYMWTDSTTVLQWLNFTEK